MTRTSDAAPGVYSLPGAIRPGISEQSGSGARIKGMRNHVMNSAARAEVRGEGRRIPSHNTDRPANSLPERRRMRKGGPMRDNRLVSRAAWLLAFLLGQASLLFGLMIALG